MKSTLGLTLVSIVLFASPYAAAQQPSEPPSAPQAPAPQPAAPQGQPAADEHADHGRFRFGINPTLGLETVSASGTSISGTMYGLDLRMGWQVNNLFAVYAHPHLSFGELGTTGGGVPISGFTGTFIGTVMAEATLIDRLFVGAGAGYGVLNNPSGVAIEGRLGGYPLMGRGPDGVRRKGLMIGGDVRAVFVDGATGTLLMGCIGYEAF